MLVSAVQQSESAICIHISPYLLPLASLPIFMARCHVCNLLSSVCMLRNLNPRSSGFQMGVHLFRAKVPWTPLVSQKNKPSWSFPLKERHSRGAHRKALFWIPFLLESGHPRTAGTRNGPHLPAGTFQLLLPHWPGLGVSDMMAKPACWVEPISQASVALKLEAGFHVVPKPPCLLAWRARVRPRLDRC